jgi:hypothetical protein
LKRLVDLDQLLDVEPGFGQFDPELIVIVAEQVAIQLKQFVEDRHADLEADCVHVYYGVLFMLYVLTV